MTSVDIQTLQYLQQQVAEIVDKLEAVKSDTSLSLNDFVTSVDYTFTSTENAIKLIADSLANLIKRVDEIEKLSTKIDSINTDINDMFGRISTLEKTVLDIQAGLNTKPIFIETT